jgi:hypothetical protein
MKLLGLSTVRCCGEKENLLAGLLGNPADEMVTLLLAGGGARRSRAWTQRSAILTLLDKTSRRVSDFMKSTLIT